MGARILVLSASVGAGHVRAAEAVEAAIKQTLLDAVVRHIDVLEMTNRLFRRIYGKLYLDLVNRAPHVLGYFYDMLDQPSRSGHNRSDRFRLALQKLNLGSFIKFLKRDEWDLVINTHFLPAEIISNLRKDKLIDLPQATVTTDFDTHRLWVNQPCDRYFTATKEGALYLQRWGVPAKDIFPTGIPVHPVFSEPKDRKALAAKHGVDAGKPIVLQLAGGFGVGPIEKLFEALTQVEVPTQFVSIAGKNEKLKKELEKMPVPARHRVKVMGFTKEIDELMQLADLVVSKPGGLTTSETLARGAVMVIVNPIPGQESRNSDYLLESGAAVKVNNLATLPYKVTQLLTDRDRLEALRANVRRIARPKAAFDVVAKSLELIQ
ncbi:MAG: glycosyltransferase [Gemmataceae bacterium]|nr:glycosyltransferase [Gemmataceae bacterium]MCI0738140.1 glycosyltransferase [Gemmataceae bacterium]